MDERGFRHHLEPFKDLMLMPKTKGVHSRRAGDLGRRQRKLEGVEGLRADLTSVQVTQKGRSQQVELEDRNLL